MGHHVFAYGITETRGRQFFKQRYSLQQIKYISFQIVSIVFKTMKQGVIFDMLCQKCWPHLTFLQLALETELTFMICWLSFTFAHMNL